MAKKKVGPSDFAAEIERLTAEGKMPSLQQVLDAIADTREKYAAKILETHKSG
jgi:hypothetical protein